MYIDLNYYVHNNNVKTEYRGWVFINVLILINNCKFHSKTNFKQNSIFIKIFKTIGLYKIK